MFLICAVKFNKSSIDFQTGGIWDSLVSAVTRLDNRGTELNSWREQESFLFSKASKRSPGPTQPLILEVLVIFLRNKAGGS